MNFMGKVVSFSVGSYLVYKLANGPSQLRYERYLTLQPESKFTGLLAYNFFHTDAMSLAFNMAVMSSLGRYTYQTMGQNKFIQLFGMGALGSALFCGVTAYRYSDFSAAGMMGPSAALISYHFFANPSWIKVWHFNPTMCFALFVFYSFLYNDQAALGGLSAGYLAFLMAM